MEKVRAYSHGELLAMLKRAGRMMQGVFVPMIAKIGQDCKAVV